MTEADFTADSHSCITGPWSAALKGTECQLAAEEPGGNRLQHRRVRWSSSSKSAAPRRLRSTLCTLSCTVKRLWWTVLNTGDTYDPDTQLSETEAAWEVMPHSNLHAVRMPLIAHSVTGAGQTTFLPVRLILEAKKTVQRPVQPLTSWTPRSWTKEVKLDRIKGQANITKASKISGFWSHFHGVATIFSSAAKSQCPHSRHPSLQSILLGYA